jgi:hypothetical protein
MILEAFLAFLPQFSSFIAVITLAFGVWQYWKAQKWKRAEFVAAQIKEFEGNPLVRRAMRMLDFPEDPIKLDGQAISLSQEILAEALPHEDLKRKFSPGEIEIRRAFCDFFDGLERMHHFLQVGLIDIEHLTPYLKYWFRRFATTDYMNQDFLYSVWTFIDGYEYEGVRQLAEHFGFQPPQPDEARQHVKKRAQSNVAKSIGG